MKTKKEIQSIIDHLPSERFGRVNLPYGLHTKGLDRSPTRDMIFPASLKGKSVLDVGSAYGYLCFEAEDLGATRVLGLEVKPPRLKRANLFKDLRESKVEFRNEDVTLFQLEEDFDYVVILNVLHHLRTPKPKEVLEFLGRRAKEKLIVESPVSAMQMIDALFEKVEYFPSVLTSKRKEQRQIAIIQTGKA